VFGGEHGSSKLNPQGMQRWMEGMSNREMINADSTGGHAT
jgi:hypothetical protein